MANAEAVRTIELRRLYELELQRALYGPHTEAAVLLEIADLRAKYGSDAVAVSKETGPHLQASVSNFADEIDFVRTLLAVVLRKIETIERRQDWRNIWMALLSLVVFLLIVTVIIAATVRVFS